MNITKSGLAKSLPLLAAAGIAAGMLVGPAAASAAIPLCTSAQLVPRYVGSEGAAGTFYDRWQLTNVATSCHTQGWVGGLNFGPDGRPLPTTLHRTAGPSTAIVLAHGQHASWSFGYLDPGVLGCAPENAVAMILTPPDNFSPVLAPRGEPACNGDLVYESPLVLGG
ncbi:MAG: DUF4232 domain-containing protein [Jatrophihabitantaceae bacterium]